MSKSELIIKRREQCEHAKQTRGTEVLNGSLNPSKRENSGNNKASTTQKIINPIYIEPLELQEPQIKRPTFTCHVDWFKVNGRKYKPGVYFHGINKDGEIDMWISSPIEILAMSSSVDDNNFGRFLRFVDSNGRWHEMAMPMFLLGGSLDELCKQLLSRGVLIDLCLATAIIPI